MIAYWNAVALLNFFVDLLLLLCTNRLCGCSPGWGRLTLSAAVGGAHSAACMLTGFSFLGNTLWRIVFLGIMGWIAFGTNKCAVRRTIIFLMLCMALGGVVQGFETKGAIPLLLSAAGICCLSFLGFRDRPGSTKYVPVEVFYGEKCLRFTALYDSGNTLTDPVSGKPVLVVGADVAHQLMNLTQEQLRNPVSTIRSAQIPGLRLIPYTSVGQPVGMLLGRCFKQVRIGKWKGSSLVAFAPDGLCSDGQYQALTGGTV